MKIYTKKGDSGETGLFGGERIPKDDLRIRAYGTVDELNACLGIVAQEAVGSIPYLEGIVVRIQAELFQLGAELATPPGRKVPTKLLESLEVEKLEQEIDWMESHLEPLKNFILPGGSRTAAFLHLARTISRRAERETVSLHRGRPLRGVVLEYLNRLSDHLFVCARFANHSVQRPDIPWNT